LFFLSDAGINVTWLHVEECGFRKEKHKSNFGEKKNIFKKWMETKCRHSFLKKKNFCRHFFVFVFDENYRFLRIQTESFVAMTAFLMLQKCKFWLSWIFCKANKERCVSEYLYVCKQRRVFRDVMAHCKNKQLTQLKL
jgi:hypothetical protein